MPAPYRDGDFGQVALAESGAEIFTCAEVATTRSGERTCALIPDWSYGNIET
jgi:hypothetical protein